MPRPRPARLATSLGYQVIDAGGLRMARSLEEMAFLNISLNATKGWVWQSGWKARRSDGSAVTSRFATARVAWAGSADPAAPLVVLLHGRGADEQSILAMADHLPEGPCLRGRPSADRRGRRVCLVCQPGNRPARR